jgi:hypothetical protein
MATAFRLVLADSRTHLLVKMNLYHDVPQRL